MKKNPFGKKGDFITSPGISYLFSEMLALWIVAFWEHLERPKKFNVVELGPGNGELSQILIKTLSRDPLKKNRLFLHKHLKMVREQCLLSFLQNQNLLCVIFLGIVLPGKF